LRRLLRLITRRYRSLRSLVANRPPSSATSGRRSGGITGITDRIIHSGLFPDFLNPNTSLSRFASFFAFCLLPVSSSSTRQVSISLSKSIRDNSSWTASAPIPTRKPSGNCERCSVYSSSVNNCLTFNGQFGSETSKTMKASK